MRRRDFIAGIAGATATWPLGARAQQPMPVIGFLGQNTAAAQALWTAAFLRRLGELGWVEGRTIRLEYRWAEGRSEHFTAFAEEFVRRKVDLIVVGGTAAIIAAKKATSIIPIVFPVATDPVGTGLVASLARPGGNVTGMSVQSADSAAKRFEMLRELVPELRRLGSWPMPATPPMFSRSAR